MAIKRPTSAPNPRVPLSRKPARLRPFSALSLVECSTGHRTGQPGPILREPGAIPAPYGSELGPPLSIRQAARVIGCSPWTVRQKLLLKGLPHLRFAASGKLIFYRDQVIRWIEFQQQGGQLTP